MATPKQSIILRSNVFGRIELPVIPYPIHSNTFALGDKVITFDALFPNENLQEKDFEMYIYEGAKNLVEIHVGDELKYGIFDTFDSPRIYVMEI